MRILHPIAVNWWMIFKFKVLFLVSALLLVKKQTIAATIFRKMTELTSNWSNLKVGQIDGQQSDTNCTMASKLSKNQNKVARYAVFFNNFYSRVGRTKGFPSHRPLFEFL